MAGRTTLKKSYARRSGIFASGFRMDRKTEERDRYGRGAWPMSWMANHELKLKDYDFHFSFGKGTHNPAQGCGGVS